MRFLNCKIMNYELYNNYQPRIGYNNFNFGYNFNFQMPNTTPQYNENLKLIHNKPEIGSEANLPEDKLIELKQSPARQKLSVVLHECDNKCFSVTEQDIALINIIAHSGMDKLFNYEELLNSTLINKTEKIISVIQGIDKLDTANMTEAEMEAKADEFSKIIEHEKSEMATLRQLLAEGAELAKKYVNQNNDNELQNDIRKFGEKISSFAQNATADENTQTTETEEK